MQCPLAQGSGRRAIQARSRHRLSAPYPNAARTGRPGQLQVPRISRQSRLNPPPIPEPAWPAFPNSSINCLWRCKTYNHALYKASCRKGSLELWRKLMSASTAPYLLLLMRRTVNQPRTMRGISTMTTLFRIGCAPPWSTCSGLVFRN
jgi:hypothetical protein